MRSSYWISLLRTLPEHYHAKLLLVSASGHEINIGSIFRMEEDYMILRGRLAGSTDAGTFVFMPYSQINYISFREEIKEVEMAKVFGESGQPITAPPPAAAAAPPPPPPEVPTPEPAPTAAPIAPAPATGPLPGKAALLERLRRSRGPGNP